MPVLIIGSEKNYTSSEVINGLFTLMDENGYIVKKFSDENNVAVNSYTDKLEMFITGDAKINSLTIMYNGNRNSTEAVSFPIPYGLSVYLQSCNLEINNMFKILPGGKIVVDENSTITLKDLNISDNYPTGLAVYDNYDYTDAPIDMYPNLTQLEANGLSKSGVLIIDGVLKIDSEGIYLGGRITGTGKIIKDYVTNNAYQQEVPSSANNTLKKDLLRLYFNGKEIKRSDIGIYK